jgi:hypothetical protein
LWSWLDPGVAEHPATTSDEMINAEIRDEAVILFIGESPHARSSPKLSHQIIFIINRSFARVFQVVDGNPERRAPMRRQN